MVNEIAWEWRAGLGAADSSPTELLIVLGALLLATLVVAFWRLIILSYRTGDTLQARWAFAEFAKARGLRLDEELIASGTYLECFVRIEYEPATRSSPGFLKIEVRPLDKECQGNLTPPKLAKLESYLSEHRTEFQLRDGLLVVRKQIGWRGFADAAESELPLAAQRASVVLVEALSPGKAESSGHA